MSLCATCKTSTLLAGGITFNTCNHKICWFCALSIFPASTESVNIENNVTRHNEPPRRINCPLKYMYFFHCNGFIHEDEISSLPDEVSVFVENFHILDPNVSRHSIASLIGSKLPDDLSIVSGTKNVVHESPYVVIRSITKTETKSHQDMLIEEVIKQRGMTLDQAKLFIKELPVIETQRAISCPICLTEVPSGYGIVLYGCSHSFCRECISKHILSNHNASIQCPFVDDRSRCQVPLRLTEVQTLVSSEDFNRHCVKSILEESEASIPNSFHCRTPDCKGFCIKEGSTRFNFNCPVCLKNNCLKCETIHSSRITCETARYENMSNDEQKAEHKKNEQLNEKTINDHLSDGRYQKCPNCSTVIEKNGGCPNMVCKNCKKQFRWKGVEKDDTCIIV